jgi:tripartite-type tricarboxylate transporter receptor subunit TctC
LTFILEETAQHKTICRESGGKKGEVLMTSNIFVGHASPSATLNKASQRGIIPKLVKIACLVATCATFMGQAAWAQTYPSRKIQIVVPFTPGGGNDVLGRTIALKLTELWGQPVVVENKPGAGGNIGADFVAKAAPDGYTFLVAANSILTINPVMYEKITFDPVKDFAPVGLIGRLPMLLVANPSLPAQSLSELVALAKEKPDTIAYGSPGNGSPQHLSTAMLSSLAGIKLQHVPYRGATPILTDLLSGQLQIAFNAINSALPLVQAAKLRALGVTTPQRLSYIPDVPTIAESGFPSFQSDIWIALVAPAGTPNDIVTKVNRAVQHMFMLADVREKLAAQGIDPVTSTPDQLADLIKADSARWAPLLRTLGVRP